MVQLNLAITPKFTRPELLLHPSVPKYLSGVNPRTINRQEWWDLVRKEVYAENNHCCYACGVYQLDAVYEQFLDAHETYTYDYKKFEAYPDEIVALCRACHWFIHFRRVRWFHIRKEVVIRGLRFLADEGLPVPYWQHRLAENYRWNWGELDYWNLQVQDRPHSLLHLFSSKWVLVSDGVKYNMGGVVK